MQEQNPVPEQVHQPEMQIPVRALQIGPNSPQVDGLFHGPPGQSENDFYAANGMVLELVRTHAKSYPPEEQQEAF